VILPKEQQRFDKLTRWVQWYAPKLANDRAVVGTMEELVGIDHHQVVGALRWGHGPTISIVPELDCRGPAAGCFRSASPDALEIDERIVTAYQQGADRETRFTGSHRVPKPGIVLLHELVHWADYKANGRRTAVGAPYHDIGSKWEWLVFATFLPEMAND
jgi:hypothetical protein